MPNEVGVGVDEQPEIDSHRETGGQEELPWLNPFGLVDLEWVTRISAGTSHRHRSRLALRLESRAELLPALVDETGDVVRSHSEDEPLRPLDPGELAFQGRYVVHFDAGICTAGVLGIVPIDRRINQLVGLVDQREPVAEFAIGSCFGFEFQSPRDVRTQNDADMTACFTDGGIRYVPARLAADCLLLGSSQHKHRQLVCIFRRLLRVQFDVGSKWAGPPFVIEPAVFAQIVVNFFTFDVVWH